MANLITQLKRSGYFDNVEIKTAVEDDIVPSVETYNFSMTAPSVLQPAQASSRKTQPAGCTGSSTRSRPKGRS